MVSDDAQFDVIVIGSGPSGVHAAAEALERGRRVALIHIGFAQEEKFRKIPQKSFSELRHGDVAQHEYFLGDHFKLNFASNHPRGGAHLTPPRAYMVRESDRIFPTGNADEFTPLLATGQGGLGISWGANCFTFNAEELKRAGLSKAAIDPFYKKVALNIGVSGNSHAPTAKQFFDGPKLQSPLPIDTNCAQIYAKFSEMTNTLGFQLGPSYLAMLSEALDVRDKNPLYDMDFYSDFNSSVWRPEYLLTRLKEDPNFTELSGYKVEKFKEETERVVVHGKSLSGDHIEWTSSKLFVCAGALNSARIVATSLRLFDHKLPVLCNQNIWIAALNWRMLGQPAKNARHSLSQLTAAFAEGSKVPLVAHFYSYRSLLFFRLLSRLPLPEKIGTIFLRLILNSLTLINVHFDDDLNQVATNLSVDQAGTMHFDSAASVKHPLESKLKLFLIKLSCWPLSTERPLRGASLHYAGTTSSLATPDGLLTNHNRVHIADSSSWRYLPAKGLTFTLMAYARWVVAQALDEK